MRICLDQDEVLAQFISKLLKWWNEDTTNKFIKIEEIIDFNLSKISKDFNNFAHAAMRYPDFYQDLEPVPGAIEGVKSLLSAGHDVIIVSAIPKLADICFHGKNVWIKKYMPFFDLNNFVGCRRKDLINGDILLDDGLHNIEAFRKIGKEAVIFDQPWNQQDNGKRVKSWPEFVNYIAFLTRNKNE